MPALLAAPNVNILAVISAPLVSRSNDNLIVPAINSATLDICSIDQPGRIEAAHGTIIQSDTRTEEADMQKVILGALAMAGLIVGMSTIAPASPAPHLLDPNTTVHATSIEHVAYYWNHRRYRHRSWDRGRRRWRYY
jgi:hypothetical protein